VTAINLSIKKSDKLIIVFYIILACSYGTFILFSTFEVEPNLVKSIIPQKITDFETSVLVDVNKEIIFDLMADIENFPYILPENINYIKILDKNDNTIFAEEKLSESIISVTLTAKHTIQPYSKHIIEILDGDAKGTIITQSFESIGSQTKITTNVHLNVQGATNIVAYIPESNLVHAVNTVVSHFVDYTKRDVFENKVNALYVEILLRPVDPEGLLHYSSLLRNGQITEDDLRLILLNSDERSMSEMKSIDQLSDETKNIINNLYEKILLRPADPEGMKYFGNILEIGTSSDEIRTRLLESEEGKNVSVFHPIRSQINYLHLEILDRSATDDELTYYHEMIDNNSMTMDDITKELKDSNEYINLKK
jgi:ribosome-associated toxin RatA of RatAB toxin-antitoxin module